MISFEFFPSIRDSRSLQPSIDEYVIKQCRQYDSNSDSIFLQPCGDYPTDTLLTLRGCFFDMPPSVHANLIKSAKIGPSDNLTEAMKKGDSIMKMYEQVGNRLQSALRDKCPAYVLLDLSSHDFFIGAEEAESFDRTIVYDIFMMVVFEYESQFSSEEYYPELSQDIFEIKKRMNLPLYVWNPHIAEYTDIINQLLENNYGSNDRRASCQTLVWLMLRGLILAESSRRWTYPSGEFRIERPEETEEYEYRFRLFKSRMHDFIKQAKVGNPYCNNIWSWIFLTQALVYQVGIIGIAKEIEQPFRMFLPIFSQNDAFNKLTSTYPSHYSRRYCFAFLFIPDQNEQLGDFGELMPAYIHEFFHYVSPKDRLSRNKYVLHLVIHAVLYDLREKLFMSDLANENYVRFRKQYRLFVDNIYQSIIEQEKLLNGDVKSDSEISDSMYYLMVYCELYKRIDIGKCYDLAMIATADEMSMPIYKLAKQLCISAWSKNFARYLAMFTMALREIRSDISMCVILGLSIDDYIRIMADEQQWAEDSAADTADSVIIRLGIMTQYLTQTDRPTASERLSYIKEIISSNLKSVPTNKKSHLENMNTYIDEYGVMSIERTKNQFTEYGHSFFDEFLQPLIKQWEDEAKWYANTDCFKAISTYYFEYVAEHDAGKKARMNNKANLILRDLFSYWEPHIPEKLFDEQ